MSAAPGTPPPAQPRSHYHPHSDTPMVPGSAQPASKRSGRKSKNKNTTPTPPVRYDSDHISESAAMASPTKTHASRVSHPTPNSSSRKNKTQRLNGIHGSSGSAQIPQIDGTACLSPYTTPSRPLNVTATPMKPAAYAGPTFHASPAASTLPLPKFFSKSVPSQNPTSGLQAKLDAEDSSSATPDPTIPLPEPPAIPTPAPMEESPLDLFFNAHRAERARQSNAASGQLATSASPSTAPPLNRTSSSSSYQYSAHGNSPRLRRTPIAPSSGKEMFMMELDGAGEHDESDPVPPSVPFKERLQSARSANKPQGGVPSPTPDDLWRQRKSEALKKMLFIQQQQQPPPETTPSTQAHHHHHQRHQSTPYDLYNSSGTAAAISPPAQENQRRPDVVSMENDLRRLLKLDS